MSKKIAVSLVGSKSDISSPADIGNDDINYATTTSILPRLLVTILVDACTRPCTYI